MTTRIVKSEQDRDLLLKLIKNQRPPFTVTIVKGAPRTVDQNKLQRLWVNEISEQLGDQTPEEVRGYCKLAIGVPILRAENEAFAIKYDAFIKPLPYEQKLAIMCEPLDLPITRLMTTKQLSKYLDTIYKMFTEQGLKLTDPNMRGR
jgi:hypothetical protein